MTIGIFGNRIIFPKTFVCETIDYPQTDAGCPLRTGIDQG